MTLTPKKTFDIVATYHDDGSVKFVVKIDGLCDVWFDTFDEAFDYGSEHTQ